MSERGIRAWMARRRQARDDLVDDISKMSKRQQKRRWVVTGRSTRSRASRGGPWGSDLNPDVQRGTELTAQLRRPIVRYVWRSGANIAARDWRLADTGRPLVGSGRRDLLDQPETADERVTVRP